MHRWPACRSRIAVQLPAGRDVGIGSTATGIPERVQPHALAALARRDVHCYCGARPEAFSPIVISGTAQSLDVRTELVLADQDAQRETPTENTNRGPV